MRLASLGALGAAFERVHFSLLLAALSRKRGSRWLCLVALALATLLAGTTAHAAVFVVNSTADTANWSPLNTACETAPGNGVCTLRAAVMASNAAPGFDEIALPFGDFTMTRG